MASTGKADRLLAARLKIEPAQLRDRLRSIKGDHGFQWLELHLEERLGERVVSDTWLWRYLKGEGYERKS